MTEPQPEAVLLSYTLEPGSSFTYEVDLEQRIDLTSEGDGSAVGDEDLPGEMSILVSGTTDFTHTVAEGPEAGTYEVRIQGVFDDMSVEGRIDGAPVQQGDIPEVAELSPIDVTVIVDEQGNLIPQESDLDSLGGALGGLEGLGAFAAGTDLGRLVGPLLPDEPVTVGDIWVETIETPTPMGVNEPITTETTSVVTGTGTVDGEEVLVIDTLMVTSMIEFDLAEFLIGFFSAFMPDDASPEDQAELDALTEDLKFQFSIDESSGEMTTWFDARAGVARQAEFQSSVHMIMDINMPDQVTGELIELILDMTIDQAANYRLVR